VQAPANAGSGVATVRLSFDACKTRKIAPAVVTVPVNPR
jgi:hypothetical protein